MNINCPTQVIVKIDKSKPYAKTQKNTCKCKQTILRKVYGNSKAATGKKSYLGNIFLRKLRFKN